MNQYIISVNGYTMWTIDCVEAAWRAYTRAKELSTVYTALVVAKTGEIIADSTGYRA